MKYKFALFFTLIMNLLSAQSVDSVAVKQVDSLIEVSQSLTAKRQFDEALKVNEQAEKIALEKLGKQSAAYGSCCFNRGKVLFYKIDYPQAEKWYLESEAIQEKVLGKEHPVYASTLNYLATLYYALGQYEKAYPLLLEAKSIAEKTMGKDHPQYTASLNNLAALYFDMGQYENAEPLYLETKDIREKLLGKEHPNYALSLNNLAALYYAIGQYEKAEVLILESKAIREKVLGRDHPQYAITLNNLAALYYAIGQYEKAEPPNLEAKAIAEKTMGKDHPDYASSLNNLANLYNEMGQYEKAEPLYLEAKAIREKALGKDHPDYAGTLLSQGSLYRNMGQYQKAEPVYLELSTTNKILIERAMHHLSEKELNTYMNQFSRSLKLTLSVSQNIQSKGMTSASYDNVLFYKGFLMQAATQVKRLALSDTIATEKYNLLKSYGRKLAAEYSKPIAERKGVSLLEEKANALEKDLARTVAGYGEAMRQVTWKEVQSNLKEGEAAIEFVHYRYYDKKATDSMMYAALLLRKEISTPVFIPLFEQGALDSLLQVQNERKADYVNALYTLADRGAVAIEAPKKSLYEILWQPLEKELTGIKTIYFSPSGLLHRINLDAIPLSEAETLADKYQLIELNSTRQLVIPTQVKIAKNDAVLFGGIQYEQDTTLQNNEPLIASQSRGELSFNYVDSTLRGGSWNYLAGTEREVNLIEKLMLAAGMKVNLKKGYQATEASFKNIGANNATSPKILHIATHGYFFPDPDRANSPNSGVAHDSATSEGTAKAASSKPKVEFKSNESVFKISDHPMLRSGLILAGGNAAWQGKHTPEGREDGILTAYEISQMNLSNTELVVLSACETGLGDIKGNEGVYGLQRAFKIAGAKYLIMSLWQVPDKQTSLLMTTFYKKWLEGKMAIPDAFHAAQKELREAGLDPYQWAGFVLLN